MATDRMATAPSSAKPRTTVRQLSPCVAGILVGIIGIASTSQLVSMTQNADADRYVQLSFRVLCDGTSGLPIPS